MVNDTTFKYLFKNDKVRPILIRLVKYYTDVDLNGFIFTDNELNTGNDLMDYRLDCILMSKDKKHIVNIEMNNGGDSYILDRNRSYINRIAGNLLDVGDDYEKLKEYKIEQVNFNNFYAKENKDIEVNTYKLTDLEHNLTIENFKIHNIYIPKAAEVCYNKENKVIKLFTCKSYEEMREIAKDNEEMNMLISELEKLNKEKYFGGLYNIKEDTEKRMKAEKCIGYKEGMEDGFHEGHEQGIIETAKKMKEDNLSIETIIKCTDLSKEEIEKL